MTRMSGPKKTQVQSQNHNENHSTPAWRVSGSLSGYINSKLGDLGLAQKSKKTSSDVTRLLTQDLDPKST